MVAPDEERALARIADILGVTGSPDMIAEVVRARLALHERSVETWAAAMGRVLDALGLGGAGHADALADRAVAKIAHLRAIVEAADALRVAVMRRVQVGSPGSSWLHDATDAYDRARRGER